MSSIKYFIKGTLKGSKCYDTYTDTLLDYELPKWMEEIKSLFKTDEYDELAQYIDSDSKLYGVVTEMWVDVKLIKGRLFSWTEVTANRELTEDEKKALLKYLSGQFSDGYGEGLEQDEFYSAMEYEECEEYDEESEEYYTDEYEVKTSYYLHLWQSEDFALEFVEEEPAEETPYVKKPRCKLVGEDGNIFNLIGIASRALKQAGLKDSAKEMQNKVTRSGSYQEALAIIMEYVEVM